MQVLQEEIKALRSKMSSVSERTAEDVILSVPEEQREMIKACLKSAKVEKHGRRYTADWVYECILMRMKGPKLYRKLRDDNKLPLPADATLRRYIRKLRPVYGFQDSVFAMMREKSANFTEPGRRGNNRLNRKIEFYSSFISCKENLEH